MGQVLRKVQNGKYPVHTAHGEQQAMVDMATETSIAKHVLNDQQRSNPGRGVK